MGNAIASITTAFTWSDVREDLPSFGWFESDSELNANISSLQGTSAGTLNANRLSRARDAQQQLHSASQKDPYKLTTVNLKSSSGGGGNSNKTPSKRSAAKGRKRKESPTKPDEDEDMTGGEAAVIELASPRDVRAVGGAVSSTVAAHPSSLAHSTSEHSLRKRSTSNSSSNGGNARGVSTSNPFNMLSAQFANAGPGAAQHQQQHQASKKSLATAAAMAVQSRKLSAANHASSAASAHVPPPTQSRDNEFHAPSSLKAHGGEVKYSSNPRLTAARVKQTLSTRPAAAAAASAAAVCTPTTTRSTSSAAAAPMVSPSVSFAQMARGGKNAPASVAMGSPLATLPESAASRSEFYSLPLGSPSSSIPRIAPPPPAPSSFMLPTPSAGSFAFPTAASAGAAAPGQEDMDAVKGLSAEFLKEAVGIWEERVAAKKREEVDAKAKAEAAAKDTASLLAQSVAASAVPMAPAMDIPCAPPMAPPMAPPCAPPMAPGQPMTRSASAPSHSHAGPKGGLKKFHWSSIDAPGVDTLWAELASAGVEDVGGMELDADHVRSAFATVPAARKAAAAAAAAAASAAEDADMLDSSSAHADADAMELSTPVKTRSLPVKVVKPKVSLLEPKRAQAVSIALARLKKSAEEIRAMLVELRMADSEGGAALSEEVLELLAKIVPSAEEAAAVRDWVAAEATKSESERSELAPSESVHAALADLPRLGERVAVLRLANAFPSTLERVSHWLGVVEESCKEVRGSKGLKAVLFFVLKLGNFLNGGSTGGRGALAGGFKLSSLSKLRFTKSADGTTTLLHYVVSSMNAPAAASTPTAAGESAPAPATSWVDELGHVSAASKVDQSMVGGEVRSLQVDLRRIQAEAARCAVLSTRSSAAKAPQLLQADQSMSRMLGAWLEEFEPKLDALTKRFKAVGEITQALAKYFGESDLEWQNFFALFSDFMTLFRQAEVELATAERTKLEDARRKAAQQAMREKATARSKRPAFAPNTPTSAMDSSFGDASSFDFGSGASTPSAAATGDRRHTICNILSESSAASSGVRGMDLASPAPVTRRGKLAAVAEEPIKLAPFTLPTHSKSPARAARAGLSANSHVLNSPLRSTAGANASGAPQKRLASSVGGDMLTSPAKHTRLQHALNVPQGKEN